MLFLEQTEYRSKGGLELVHGYLCSPITPMTLSGKKLFLLLVDDYNRYMWVVLLSSKVCAPDAIKRVQAEAEALSGRKLKCLQIDKGQPKET
jgi:hypothetical protein